MYKLYSLLGFALFISFFSAAEEEEVIIIGSYVESKDRDASPVD